MMGHEVATCCCGRHITGERRKATEPSKVAVITEESGSESSTSSLSQTDERKRVILHEEKNYDQFLASK